MSSNRNYSDSFLRHKQRAENTQLTFPSDNSEPYNAAFTFSELLNSLVATKNTAPGPDGIYYQMLKNLPRHVQEHLLAIYKKFWLASYFPPEWSRATVIPFAKPGRPHSDPRNYRPIALTSCICKTFERMINVSLADYLEMHGILSSIQCGGRSNRSTTDHLVRLESVIRRAFVHGEHFISVFFDMEKAYDMTWRCGILKDLHDIGLRGYLPR